jgi:hypothetical protein
MSHNLAKDVPLVAGTKEWSGDAKSKSVREYCAQIERFAKVSDCTEQEPGAGSHRKADDIPAVAGCQLAAGMAAGAAMASAYPSQNHADITDNFMCANYNMVCKPCLPPVLVGNGGAALSASPDYTKYAVFVLDRGAAVDQIDYSRSEVQGTYEGQYSPP